VLPLQPSGSPRDSSGLPRKTAGTLPVGNLHFQMESSPKIPIYLVSVVRFPVSTVSAQRHRVSEFGLMTQLGKDLQRASHASQASSGGLVG
jgi:hypothetical protein